MIRKRVFCKRFVSYQCGEEKVVIFSHHSHGQNLNREKVFESFLFNGTVEVCSSHNK